MPSLFTTSCEAGVCCGLWTFCRVNFMWGGDDQHPAACCPDSLCLWTSRTLYHLQDGVEHPESQHEQFAGRVHFDQNDFRNGLIRLHLSRLRSNDSGIYQCQVFSGENEGGSECLLNVTAARTQSTAEKTKPSSLGMICLLVGSGLLLESISLFCAPLCMDTFLLNESPPSGKMSSPQSEPPSADQGRLDPLQHLCSD
ncbi:uncharacterized protein LOC115376424 isoform X3 [Myripristis murdjan]|uniref:uncharacterized protein LOC115376424 isoform X3 n=1 Tax=Myripristis murdjan TaxID=586833 RepID=UPI0011760804|nr:uncharacterized protein LOC115376424 isoform X3 [Myripristis murdjan]